MDAFTRTWVVAVAFIAISASAHTIATHESTARVAPNRTLSDLVVAALEPAPVLGTLVETVSYLPGTETSRQTLTWTVAGAASEFEHWSLWAGGFGLIVFVVRRRLSD